MESPRSMHYALRLFFRYCYCCCAPTNRQRSQHTNFCCSRCYFLSAVGRCCTGSRPSTTTPPPMPMAPTPLLRAELPMAHSSSPLLQTLSSLGLAFFFYTTVDALLFQTLGEHWAAPVASVAILLLISCFCPIESLRYGNMDPSKRACLMLAARRTLLAFLLILSIHMAIAPFPIDPTIWAIVLSSVAILLLLLCLMKMEVQQEQREARRRWRMVATSLILILGAVFCFLTSPISIGLDITRWLAMGVIFTATGCSLYQLLFLHPPVDLQPRAVNGSGMGQG